MRHLAAHDFANLPEPWSSLLIGVIAIIVVAWIAVVVNVLKNVIRSRMDTGMKVVWIALVMSSQPLGVLLWFVVGRRSTDRVAN